MPRGYTAGVRPEGRAIIATKSPWRSKKDHVLLKSSGFETFVICFYWRKKGTLFWRFGVEEVAKWNSMNFKFSIQKWFLETMKIWTENWFGESNKGECLTTTRNFSRIFFFTKSNLVRSLRLCWAFFCRISVVKFLIKTTKNDFFTKSKKLVFFWFSFFWL